MEQEPPYPDGTNGAVLRAAFLPDYPFLWIMFLEDLSRHGDDGMLFLDKDSYEEAPGACLLKAFYFRRSNREDMWRGIAFSPVWPDTLLAEFEREVRDEFLAGRKKEEPIIENEVQRTGLVSRKIHLPKK